MTGSNIQMTSNGKLGLFQSDVGYPTLKEWGQFGINQLKLKSRHTLNNKEMSWKLEYDLGKQKRYSSCASHNKKPYG